jgi:NodT family efflux transporter outer membrane factor (OMF) lipoprotein
MKKNINKLKKYSGIVFISVLLAACTVPAWMQKTENKSVPTTFNGSNDTINTGTVKWKDYFKDQNLVSLIESALDKNQELNIRMQEIYIAQNEVRARKGAYLPFVGAFANGSVDKVGRYTSQGANDANTDIMPGKAFPEPLPNFAFGLSASWEVDIWKKLRNSRKAALRRYFSSVEGRNFMITQLVAEIASSYYELMALDNQLEILKNNIGIQQNALEIVKLEKAAARVTELAVKKFEAEVLKNQSRQYYILQQIIMTENKINFLVGRFPQPIQRDSKTFTTLTMDSIHAGIPSQLLANRPDIKQAEQSLQAAKLDVKAAKAQFYPSFMISAAGGYQAFDPKFLIQTPQSLLFSLMGELVAPIVNRNAIKAEYYSANSRQVQTVYNYERTVLNGYIEVVNQLSNISNLEKSYDLKSKQVDALTQSIDISTTLFKSARADYMEVLMTQRDALDSKFELIDTKLQQLQARVGIYQALGGGWR